MSKIIDKLIDNIIDLILEDMDCQHEVDHDENGVHTSAEYNLKYELKVRAKIMALLEPGVTEDWIEEKAKRLYEIVQLVGSSARQWIEHDKDEYIHDFKDFIRTLVKKKPEVTEEFVEKMVDESVYVLHKDKHVFFKRKLKEAGVEVVKK